MINFQLQMLYTCTRNGVSCVKKKDCIARSALCEGHVCSHAELDVGL